MKYSYYFIFVMINFFATSSTRFCDEFCQCHDSHVVCSGTKLTYIPKIPPGTTGFEMNGTGLKIIEQNGFDNFSGVFPAKMIFANNRLENIHPMALSMFELKTLQIQNEPNLKLENIKHVFDNLRKDRLKYTHLTDSAWDNLHTNLFQSFNNTRMRFLHLEGNKFTYINCSTFSKLTRLERLYLHKNKINHLTLNNITPHVQKLFLQTNNIEKIPIWCKDSEGQISHLPNVEELHLEENLIGSLGPASFRCLPKLKTLVLDKNKIGKIQDNVFSSMPSLLTLRISSISSIGHLKKIDPFAFNSSSLQTLMMDNNRFHFERKQMYDSANIFAHCKNLNHLNLAHNYMYRIEKTLETMFLPLTKLTSLDLSQSGIVNIPVLEKSVDLNSLRLQGNIIDDWKGTTVSFKNLKTLDLSANRITIITKTSFSKGLLKSLQSLDLNSNPFTCTCDLLWFTEWIKTTNTSLVGYPKFYKCNQPPSLKNEQLRNYVNAEKTCPPWNPLYTLAIVLSGSSLVFIIIIITIAKCQINIRNFIYLMRVHRKGYLPLFSSEDFEYDAFVVYCDGDGEWVRKTFLDKLESEGIKLCIHDRDFDVGECIADNVEIHLSKSRKVIVVMSNEFTKNEWCQWEVDIVHERLRNYGPDIFLLIMLSPIDSKHMTSKLRSIIKYAPCLGYKQGFGEDVFWKAVRAAISKPIGHPPTALL